MRGNFWSKRDQWLQFRLVMIAVIQRVSEASVTVEGNVVGRIGMGLLALVGIHAEDTEKQAIDLVDRIVGLRVFPDEKNHMNKSLVDVGGSLLLISQFTLVADLSRGRRPSFTSAAPASKASTLFNFFVTQARERRILVETGVFQSMMSVNLTNEGPVTFVLESRS